MTRYVFIAYHCNSSDIQGGFRVSGGARNYGDLQKLVNFANFNHARLFYCHRGDCINPEPGLPSGHIHVLFDGPGDVYEAQLMVRQYMPELTCQIGDEGYISRIQSHCTRIE